MQAETMYGGLGTMGIVERVIDHVHAYPPLEYAFAADPPRNTVAFEGGTMAHVTRYPGVVRLYLATEAGRISIIDLDPRDAATAGAIISGIDP